ncbi:MAG: conjugal transfer protein [Actinomycetota bacterium]
MELPTYTRVFTIERRLYRIFDFELPVPVSATQLGAFVVSALLVLAVGNLLGIPLTAVTLAPHLGAAAVAAWLVCQPVAERKRPHQWVASQLRFLAEPRRLFDFCDPHEPGRADLVVAVAERRPVPAEPVPALEGGP